MEARESAESHERILHANDGHVTRYGFCRSAGDDEHRGSGIHGGAKERVSVEALADERNEGLFGKIGSRIGRYPGDRLMPALEQLAPGRRQDLLQGKGRAVVRETCTHQASLRSRKESRAWARSSKLNVSSPTSW